MEPQGSQAQRGRAYTTALAWAEEASRLVREANSIIADQYFGLVAMVNEDATPEEIAVLADIWTESTKTIDECVDAASSAKQEIASIDAMGGDIAYIDDAWLAHRTANVARSLVRTKCLYAKMGEQSEEYNRICASIMMRKQSPPPHD